MTLPENENNRPWYSKGSEKLPAKVNHQILRKISKSIGISIVIAIFILSASFNPGNKIKYLDGGGVQAPPTLAGLAGGCRGISKWQSPPAEHIGWVSPGMFYWYTSPPLSGNFDKTPWKTPGYIDPKAKIQPELPSTVSNIYRGWVVIWTAIDAKEGSLDGLEEWSKNMLPGTPVLIAQWPRPEPQTWPIGRNVVFTAWNQAESCLIFDAKAAEEFRTEAKGNAPGIKLSLNEPGPAAQVRTSDLL